jgi:Ca2+-binding EF-hand superfamily protein
MKKMEADFKAIDTDCSGFVDEAELRTMANELAYKISEEELDALMEDMDENHDGKISLEEFIAATVSQFFRSYRGHSSDVQPVWRRHR